MKRKQKFIAYLAVTTCLVALHVLPAQAEDGVFLAACGMEADKSEISSRYIGRVNALERYIIHTNANIANRREAIDAYTEKMEALEKLAHKKKQQDKISALEKQIVKYQSKIQGFCGEYTKILEKLKISPATTAPATKSDETGGTTTPPVVTPAPQVAACDSNAHFEQIKAGPGILASWALRSQEEISAHGTKKNTAHAYDPLIDADKITFATMGSLGPGDQLRLVFPRAIGEGLDQNATIQWEMRYDSSWKTGDGIGNHKAIRFDDEHKVGSKDDRFIEFQTRYGSTTDEAIALPTVRIYDAVAGGDGNRDPLRVIDADFKASTEGIYNIQPGGDTKAPIKIKYGPEHHLQAPHSPFVILPERWVRVTAYMDYSTGQGRLRVVMSDEFNDPVTVIDDPAQPGLGFLVDRNNGPSRIDAIRVEFNSSQEVTFAQPKYAWVRNFVVATNTDLPHGKRPGKCK